MSERVPSSLLHLSGRSAVGIVAGLGAAVAYAATKVIDQRRVAADPNGTLLVDPPPGRPIEVRSPDGTRLSCRVVEPVLPPGAPEPPTVLLIHGWTCRRDYWAPQLNTLADSYRLVTYDLRGHGRSDPPEGGDFSAEALAHDVEAVLAAAVPEGRRALVVGHSLGAMSIVSWAGRYPESVRRRAAAALLLSTGTSDLITESLILRAPAGLSKPAAAISRRTMGAALPYGPPNPISNRVVRYVALSPSATPAQVAFCERIVLSANRRWRAATAQTLSTLDLNDALAELDVPTLVLSGSADRLTPPVLAERLSERLPQLIERVELPGIGHMSSVEAVREVNARIRDLVATYLPAPEPALSVGS